MSLSSLNLIGQTIFKLEYGNRNFDGETDKKDNKQTELHQFQREPSYDGASISLSSLNSIGQSVFELESGNGNFDGTNRQKTDK